MPSTATRPAPTRRTAAAPPAARRAAASRRAVPPAPPASRHQPAVRAVAILLVLGLLLGLFSSLLAVA
ncbi:MAG TPA: hypothetical protein VHK88_04535 [Aquihabitans sp.]|jgi:uncharacterized iron-regulated membrane protein|nr:hypothetical protein [Aquihabitans sp.]